MTEQARPDRAEEVATQRRRRDGSGLEARLNLEVPDHVRDKLAAEGLTPRWVNDTKGRVQHLTTRDDYDKVDEVEPVRVGTADDGSAIFAHLLAKRNDFIDEDRRTADQRRREIEQAQVKGGKTVGADGELREIEGQGGARMYVPDSNKIETSRRNEVS